MSASVFRAAAPAPAWRFLAKTAVQCAFIWTLFLVALPAALIQLEPGLGLPPLPLPGRRVIGALLFAAFSALNVATGAVLAVRGRGTPLPLDCPAALVPSGPYAYVRNPMAMAGLGQGVAVGVWLGSWLVVAYALAGGLVWQWGLLPAEERDLAARFGEPYHAYRSAVRCWVPRLRPYAVQKAKPAPT